MKILYYLSGFNNYYNRQIKMPSSTLVADFSEYITKIDVVENFNPNDGVSTQILVNYFDDKVNIDDNIAIDYILISEDKKNIHSRWFVLDRVRNRGGQWNLTLRRDVISDNYESVISAPTFIEKATLSADSPLLWNQEDMTFNQIKQEETLLKDGSECAWIVGYYAKNTSNEFLKGTIDMNDLVNAYDEAIDEPFNAWEYNATINPFYGAIETLDYHIYAKNFVAGIDSTPGYLRFDNTGNFNGVIYVDNTSSSLQGNGKPVAAGNELESLFQAQYSTLNSYATAYVENNKTSAEIKKFLSYDGKIIKDSEGKYYSISIVRDGNDKQEIDISAGSLYNAINGIITQGKVITGTANSASYKIYIERPKYNMVATEVFGLETTWDMTGSKFTTDDAPYNIFAIPYGTTYLENSGYTVATSNKEVSMAVANSIIRVMGSNLYDIQLLPYCPINTPMGNRVLQTYDAFAYSIVKTPSGDALENHIGYILNVPKAKFSKNLFYPINAPTDAVEKKVMNECEMYRLCSPNYNGAFDFSVAKNEGVDYFNVDCTYKPYQPYIHINPNFKGMYGMDFDDARGLICGGDFSLPQIKDNWQDYQIQNKNFQEIFDRQIENMETTNKYQRYGEIANAITGTATGAGAGVGAGMMLGGPVGALAGGAIGGTVGMIGGIADYHINEALRAEALDFTKDNFGYQLGNIKALPYSLTKVSVYNNNNKIFPFVERYSATDIEKQALRDKMKYNGMTVMAIGKIEDYLRKEPSYIKGRVIRLDNNENLEFHEAREISNEIYKGVFM